MILCADGSSSIIANVFMLNAHLITRHTNFTQPGRKPPLLLEHSVSDSTWNSKNEFISVDSNSYT